MIYRFEIDGETYEYDESETTAEEARLVQKLTVSDIHRQGLGYIAWGQAINAGEIDALLALVFLAKKRSGEAVKWADLQGTKVTQLVMQVMESLVAAYEDAFDESDAEPESDPTQEAPKPPAAKKKTRGQTPAPESSDS